MMIMERRILNNFLQFVVTGCLLIVFGACSTKGDTALAREALEAMQKASHYFRTEVAVHGGYLYRYKTDFTMREGEEIASPTTIWLEPPGTPAVGMAFLEAYKATGDTTFLNGAISAARALIWGQLASGGWDNLINFDPVESKRWHYRRDVEAGDTINSKRRNRSTLDDNKTQSALQLLMKVDKVLGFKDSEIHRASIYALDALLKAQYPNGAWPQGFIAPPDPAKFPVIKARYPDSWSREFLGVPYVDYYTFNDNTISDAIKTMVEAYKTYGDERYLNSAKYGGDFIILAQMPEPQPAWAQQYNPDMEPAWARRFEPPAISGGETFGIMRTLLDLYLETGEPRYLEPVPKALGWAEKSLLPDNRMARFYELKTNKPLYFNAPRQYSALPESAFPDLDPYTLIYEDTDLPTHYSFKVAGIERIEAIKSFYNRILDIGRDAILAQNNIKAEIDPRQVREIINNLDKQGRWVEQGRLKTRDADNPYVEAEIISTRTFIQNMSILSAYVESNF
jgi:PelA/Pel-15E family pectate lyase